MDLVSNAINRIGVDMLKDTRNPNIILFAESEISFAEEYGMLLYSGISAEDLFEAFIVCCES
jgi:hypothetical protein